MVVTEIPNTRERGKMKPPQEKREKKTKQENMFLIIVCQNRERPTLNSVNEINLCVYARSKRKERFISKIFFLSLQ